MKKTSYLIASLAASAVFALSAGAANNPIDTIADAGENAANDIINGVEQGIDNITDTGTTDTAVSDNNTADDAKDNVAVPEALEDENGIGITNDVGNTNETTDTDGNLAENNTSNLENTANPNPDTGAASAAPAIAGALLGTAAIMTATKKRTK